MTTFQVEAPAELVAAIDAEAEASHRNREEVIAEMLEEAVRMRRVPGIVFVDGPAGRRAQVGGTGLSVWEVIDIYHGFDQNWDEVLEAYPHLSLFQVKAAEAYWRAYPDEINAWRARNANVDFEAFWNEFPVTRPAWR